MGRGYRYRRTILAAAVCVLAGLLSAPAALAGTFVEVPGSPVTTGGYPNQVVFSPSGRLVATDNDGQSTVSVFSVDPSSGKLAPVPGSPFATHSVTTPSYFAAVAFSPSGN